MASAVWAFSRHAIVPRRFPGYSPMAEVSRARMDFPSYPVDIVLPSLNRADTAHDHFFKTICRRAERRRFGNRCTVEALRVAARVPGLVEQTGVNFFGAGEKLARGRVMRSVIGL